MSAALTPGVAARERSASRSRGERAARRRRSRSKPPQELPPQEQRQQPSSHARSSVHDASAGMPVTRRSPYRANSGTPMRTRSSTFSARTHPSSFVGCVNSGRDSQVDAIATAAAAAAAAAASHVCQPLPSSPFLPAVLEQIDRIRRLLLEVKLPFIDVYLVEACLLHLARRTPTTEVIDGVSVSDVAASTNRSCREPGICGDVTSMPAFTLQGAELERAPTTSSATSTSVSSVLRLKAFEILKQKCHYPFQMPARGSERHLSGRVASAALARNPSGRKAKPTTEDDSAATAHAYHCARALGPCPSSLDAQDAMDHADLMNCSQAEETRFRSSPLPPRPPRSDERPRPPARAGVVRHGTPADSCAQHWNGMPVTFPLSLLGTLERALAKYRAALAVALRAVMHREAVWTALQQFLYVVRSDWAPLTAQDAEVVALVSSRGHGGSSEAADVRLSSSDVSGALLRLHSPRCGSGDSFGDAAVGACRAEAHLLPHYTPHGVSSSPSAGESEYGAGERGSSPETQGALQTASEPTRNAVDREAARSGSALSRQQTAARARSAAHQGHAAKHAAHCMKEGHVRVALRPPEAPGGAGGGDHSRRQQRSPLRLSVDSLRQALRPFAGGAAESEGAFPCNSQSPPPRAAPLLLRLPTTPLSSTGAAKDATGGLAPARARSAFPRNCRTLQRADPSCSAGAGGPARTAAGYPTSGLRHVSPALCGLQQTRRPQRFATATYGACYRSQSAPSVTATASHSPCPPHDPSVVVAPRARIMFRQGIEARGAPSRSARSVSDPGTLMAPMREHAHRPLRASSASPAPQRQELRGASSETRRSERESATRPHSGLVPSLGVRLHAVSRQVYTSCLYHYLFYLQRTTLAVVEAVDALRRHHFSHAAPFVVEHRNYLLEVLLQMSVLASDAAVQWLMREGAVGMEMDLEAEGLPCPAAAQHSEWNSGTGPRSAACRPTPLTSLPRQGLSHTSDVRRRADGRLRTSSSRQCGVALTRDAEQADERASQLAIQRAAARGQWPEQLLRAPLMSTHASLARYAATPRFLSQLEAATSTGSGARGDATADAAPPVDGDGCQSSVPVTISPAPVTLPTLRLVLPPDVLLSYGGGAATPEDELYYTRIVSASAMGANAVPPAAALRRRLEGAERFLHCEVAAQLEYLKTCMQCALQHEYRPHLRGVAEVHRCLFSDRVEMTALRDGAAKQACLTDSDRTDVVIPIVDSIAKHGSAAATRTRVQCDRVLLQDELLRADWMRKLKISWQLLMSGNSSVE